MNIASLTWIDLALNVVVFFAGIGAHAVWLRVKAWHGRP